MEILCVGCVFLPINSRISIDVSSIHPIDMPPGVTGKRKQPGKAQLWWQKICGMNVLGEKFSR